MRLDLFPGSLESGTGVDCGMLPRMQQARALSVLKTGANVFLTGEPGSGKTFVINQYIAWLEAAGLNVAVTASTGIAATHIGGMTIHSWSGIGIKDSLSPYDLEQISTREKVVKRLQAAQVLVIDEISMLDGSVLDMVDLVLRTVRKRNEPFGGVQVVLIGDFFQLPPITRGGTAVHYAFESQVWPRAQFLTCYLTDQFRQEDELLLGLLSSIRRNEIEEEHYTLLREQTEIGFPDIEPTRLYTHNADVDAVNLTKLQELSGTTRTFKMSATGSKALIEPLIKNCLSPQNLVLKEDAMVMCTKNNFEAGFVNGTLARVTGFDGEFPIVLTSDGRTLTIKPMTWDVIDEGKVRASIEQLPLRLAWAITVHKSQGMSLDAAEIDLSKAFVYGQGYVALSRVRSLEGLKVLGMHPNALQVDPRVVARDGQFLAASTEVDDTFENLDEAELVTMHTNFVLTQGGRMPTEVDLQAPRTPTERINKESTTSQTKQLLEAGQSVAAIATIRGMTEATIYGHIETLAAAGEITSSQIERLLKDALDWGTAKPALFAAMHTHGTEKLRPLYEATDEMYDYNLIRLARLLFVADTASVESQPW